MSRLLGAVRTFGMLGVVWMTVWQPRLSFGYISSPRHKLLCGGCMSTCVGWRNHYYVNGLAGKCSSYSACYRTKMLVDGNIDLFSRVYADPLELVQWVRDIGGRLGNVHLEDIPGKGWGFRASQDLEKDETLVVIPSQWCITLSPHHHRRENNEHDVSRSMPKTIKENEGELRYSLNTEKLDPVSNQPYWTLPPPLVSLIDAVPPEYEDIRLGLVLLAERYKLGGSTWWPYLRNLPDAIVGVPLCAFDNAEMAALQDDILTRKIDERCGFLMKFVKDLLNDIPPGPYSPFGDERITFGKLTWAASVASSRAFRFDEQLQLSGGAATIKGDPVIVPMIDFVNINIGSGDGANVKVEAIRSDESSETGGSEDGQNGRGAAAPASSVQLVTTRPVAKGESLEMRPVCIVRDDNVSKIGNQELLCNYGFVDVESGRERASIDFNKNVLQYARLLVCITNERFGSRVGQNEVEPWQHKVLVDVKLEGPGADRSVYLGGDQTNKTLPADPRLLAALRAMYARSKEELQGKTGQELTDYETGKLSTYVERRVLAVLNGLNSMLKWKTTLEDDEILLYGRKTTPDLVVTEEAMSSLWRLDSIAEEATITGEADREEEEGEKEGDQELHLEISAKRGAELDIDDDSESIRDDTGSKLKPGLDRDTLGQDEEDDDDDDDDDGGDEKNLKINSELSRQMVQALKYRIAQKRSMRKVALVLRAELARIGLVKGMRLNPSLGPTLQGMADKNTVHEESE